MYDYPIDNMAHIDLWVNEVYRLTFAYPVNIAPAMALLSERLVETAEHTDQVADTLGMLVEERLATLPDDIATMSPDDQDQMVFLFCGFLKHLCDEAEDALEAGNTYTFRLDLNNDEGMIAEVYNVDTLH